MFERHDRQVERTVRQLIINGTCLKLMDMHPGEAVERFEEARRWAEHIPTLAMWKALAAYRLGHLYLRGQGVEVQLERSLEMFTEAGRNTALGPWPWIYRLPVLHRLGRTHEELHAAYMDAIGALSQQDRSMRQPQDFPRLRVPVNNNQLNLLELSCHFAGLDYSRLRGRWSDQVVDFTDLRPGEASWTILETNNGGESVALPKNLAKADFELRAKNLPAGTFAFAIGEKGPATVIQPGGESRRYVSTQGFHILARSLPGRYRTWERLLGRHDEERDEATRQARARWKRFLGDFSLTDCFVPLLAPGEVPMLKPDAHILALVETSLFAPERHLIARNETS